MEFDQTFYLIQLKATLLLLEAAFLKLPLDRLNNDNLAWGSKVKYLGGANFTINVIRLNRNTLAISIILSL